MGILGMGLGLLATFCAPVAAATQPPPPVINFRNIGNDGWFWIFRCVEQDRWWTVGCEGFAPLDLFHLTAANNQVAAFWAKNLQFEGASKNGRENASAIPEVASQRLTIRPVRRARATSFSTVGNRGYVIAHIDGDPKAVLDARYGIGQQPSGPTSEYKLTRDYYLVVDKFDTSDVQVANFSRKMSKWYVFGIDTTDGAEKPRMVKLTSSGSFRYCGFEHSSGQKGNGAQFLQCNDAKHVHHLTSELRRFGKPQEVFSHLMELIGAVQRSAVVSSPKAAGSGGPRTAMSGSQLAQLVESPVAKKIAVNLTTAQLDILTLIARDIDLPGWVNCGGGCCTADY